MVIVGPSHVHRTVNDPPSFSRPCFAALLSASPTASSISSISSPVKPHERTKFTTACRAIATFFSSLRYDAEYLADKAFPKDDEFKQ